MTVLLIPLIAGLVSIVNLIFLAYQRVLKQPKCDDNEAIKLKKLKDDMNEQAEYMKHNPAKYTEKQREIANHILSISDSIKQGATSFLVTEYKFMTVFVIFMFLIVGGATDDW